MSATRQMARGVRVQQHLYGSGQSVPVYARESGGEVGEYDDGALALMPPIP